ncbi:hypothetical protein DXV76_16725 [Rhodobacteraceae bacterium CCMM004]|nr:hypothetical protein DXV76_16725 [Rhodobacteraceae bacterium CCMM004]
MRRVLRALLLLLVAGLVALAAPVVWIETACRGSAAGDDGHVPLLPPDHRRAESRTLLTYPEWHIVHAYDDYAQVIATGDPHDFAFLRSVAGFWQTFCPLRRAAAGMGGATRETLTTIHVIGVSFTAEMLLKAVYEETLGRLAAFLRGPQRARLDDLSAAQARDYAAFLRQVPWYRWDFAADREALQNSASDALRDRERALALGIEYWAKGLYARAIGAAVAGVGQDETTLRSVVTGIAPDRLAAIAGVTVIAPLGGGTEIETPRYAAYTDILRALAAADAHMIEIAGNDEILFTAVSETPAEGALFAFRRQGYGDVRSLFVVRVIELLETIRALPERGLTLEHVHDY